MLFNCAVWTYIIPLLDVDDVDRMYAISEKGRFVIGLGVSLLWPF